MSHSRQKPEDNLYLLAFIDVVDRLDILLLEIRHLQQSIIYSLRAPSLYLPLRYEEKYLFGDNWKAFIDKGSGIQHDISLVKEWTIRYPTPSSAMRRYCEGNSDSNKNKSTNNILSAEEADKRDRILQRIIHRVGQIWMGDNWARDQRLQYNALFALQLLKQRVLRDKVALYRAAIEANLSGIKKHRNALEKPAFLILRQGVIHQADRYVAILRSHKQQVSQALDFGMPSDPHPSTERRREMGIFMDFLANRTQDIQRDILHLLNYYEPNRNLTLNKTNVLMFHGWSQKTRVSNTHLFDKTNYHYNKFVLGDKKKKRHIGYIHTSFWAPDRPDLHPIIAHEIADSVIKNTLGGLDDVALSNYNDNFTGLLIKLKKCLFKHAKDAPYFSGLKESSSGYIQKIAGDLLAAAVKGASYLYSLFLLRIASDSHHQLEVGSFIRLDMVYSLKEGTAAFDKALLWYIRIHLTATWLEKIVHIPPSALDQSIIKGSQKISNEVLAFLDGHAPSTRENRAQHWINLVEDLKKLIINSKASKNSKKWRRERSHDDWDDSKTKATGCEGEKQFSRSTKRLNIRLQNYLFRELLAQKCMRNKPLYETADSDLETQFNKIYPLEIKDQCIPHLPSYFYRQPKAMFRHMYDIPYQSAFLRSVDILTERPEDELFFQQMRWDMELGRGLFSVALEFYSRETESTEHRLSLCINQISYLHRSMKTRGESDLKAQLKTWLSCNKRQLNTTEKTHKQKPFSKLYVKKIIDHIDEVGANHINASFSYYRPIQSHIIRQLEEIAGYKLCELLIILKENIETVKNQPCYAALYSLISFLSIRRTSIKEDKARPKTLFYNYMLTALGDISVKQKQEYERSGALNKKFLPKPAPNVMIDRLSVTNTYPVPDPMTPDNDPYKNCNGLRFSEVVKRSKWQVSFTGKGVEKNEKNTWITLGRFDAVSLTEVRLPCKCYLQGFNNLTLPYKESDDQLRERFSPHFSRREIARPVEIIPCMIQEDLTQAMYKRLFAMIGVTLQRRSMRLDFLFRMIRALKEMRDNNQDISYSGIEKSIIDLKKRHIFVVAYLTDGWGDMLFTFRKYRGLEEDDLDSIFKFQQAVYEDFMVDRTEILFTPQCLDYALGKPKKYRITMHTRMMEDRWLEAGINNYTDKLCRLCEKENLPKDIISSVNITLTPGRNDFSFIFTGEEGVTKGSYKKLIKWLNGELISSSENEIEKNSAMVMLGHLETHIERLLILENKKV